MSCPHHHSSKQQVDATLKAHIARVCSKCFRCLRGMLQVLYFDVAKVDRDVAHVVMAIHVPNVLSVPDECCKRFI